MKKLFRYPFLCLLTLSVLAAMPSAWRQLGILPPGDPWRAALVDTPELRLPPTVLDPPSQAVVIAPENWNDAGDDPDEPEEPPAPVPPENPFEGALFIGDSRTVGIHLYSGITESDFFASTGMNVYTVFKEKLDVGDLKGCSLEELLKQKQYQRIYLMLGINELGNKVENVIKKYQETVDKLRELQPDAYLILEANLHMGKKRSDSDKTFNNTTLNQLNEQISQMADGQTIFYIDVNPVFDDENGYLTESITWDSVHIYGKHYPTWAEWLRENTPA